MNNQNGLIRADNSLLIDANQNMIDNRILKMWQKGLLDWVV